MLKRLSRPASQLGRLFSQKSLADRIKEAGIPLTRNGKPDFSIPGTAMRVDALMTPEERLQPLSTGKAASGPDRSANVSTVVMNDIPYITERDAALYPVQKKWNEEARKKAKEEARLLPVIVPSK